MCFVARRHVGRTVARSLFGVFAGTVLFAVMAHPLQAQTIRGLMLERATDRPIELGTVILVDQHRDTVASTITDEDGFFSVAARGAGSFRLVAEALGYRPIVLGPYEVADNGAMVVQLLMSPRPVRLDGLLVATDRSNEPEVTTLVHTGFYERLAEGRGEFMTPGEIARSTERWTVSLFWEMSYKVRAVPGGNGFGPWDDRVVILSREKNWCTPRIVVDGVWIEMMPGETLSDLVPKDDLEAIEVYQAPDGPARYLSTDPCGVILFWTVAY